MGIIEQIRFFFFDVEDPVRMTKKTQPVIKNCAEKIQKIEKQGVWIAKKKAKIYIRYSQKNKALYVELFSKAYLGPIWTSMMERFCGRS